METLTVKERIAPGPRGHFLVGSVPEFRRDPLALLEAAAREHGDVTRFRIGPTITLHLLTNPEHIKHVLQTNQRNYARHTRSVAAMREAIGDGLLTSDEDFWRRQRRMAQPAFHREFMSGLGTLATDSAERAVERLRVRADKQSGFDLIPELLELTLRVQGLAVLGADLAALKDGETSLAASVELILREIADRMRAFVPVPRRLPTPANVRFNRALKALDAVVYAAITERRSSSGKPLAPDLLSQLVEARDADTGEGMSDRQLRDELLTLLIAGHETTAMSLGWTFHLLSRHPRERARLEEELETVLSGRTPTMADLPKLPFTRMVLDESMRLYPPVWAFERSVIADDVIGGCRIPAGSIVLMSPYVTQRDPALFRDPERFEPERFAAPDPARPRYAYFPFGGGQHLCIGAALAMSQMQLVLATVASKLRFDAAPDARIEFEPLITLRPKYGLRMTASAVDSGHRAKEVRALS